MPTPLPPGTPGVADFSIFTTRAISSLVRQGVRETLANDQELAHFLGASATVGIITHYNTDGRVFASPSLDILPDASTPFCCVYCSAEEVNLQLNTQAEWVVPVVIRLVWDQYEDTIADGDHSVEDFFNRVRYALVSDQRLENTSLGNPYGRGLADLISGFQTINYMSQATNDGTRVTCMQEMVVTYRITGEVATGISDVTH